MGKSKKHVVVVMSKQDVARVEFRRSVVHLGTDELTYRLSENARQSSNLALDVAAAQAHINVARSDIKRLDLESMVLRHEIDARRQ